MTDNKVRVACVQPSSGQDMAENLRIACELVRVAEGEGAKLIALPENVALMDHRTEALHAQAAALDAHPAIAAFADIARETGAWIIAGSVGARTAIAGSPIAQFSSMATAPSPPDMIRFICLMLICQMARSTANPTPSVPAMMPLSRKRPGADLA